jgi:hypothetical protein
MSESELARTLTRFAALANQVQAAAAKICGSEPAKTRLMGSLVTNVQHVLLLLGAFPDCVGYSNNRRGTPILDLSNEDRVQDLVYFMLRPALTDLVPEQPASGTTRQYSIEDYLSKELKTVVEAKRIRNKTHGKTVKGELNDDVGNYKNDSNCHHLIFFLYDPDKHIESPTGLKKAVEGRHVHNGNVLNVYCIVQT